ncbi:MAG: signal peptide peptidase SppA [Cyanothece sp. SIO1E1]|nr:signal peptide peptidase SppA [Cyanothece sp. SIO1E1]
MRNFFKYAFASAVGTLASLILLLSLLSVGAGSLILFLFSTASGDTGPKIEDKSILSFDLSIDMTDSAPLNGVDWFLSPEPVMSLRTVLDCLEAAAKDDRIVGLYLHGHTKAGLATLKEIRDALEKFKATGKPITAYEVNWSERDYYLASVADRVLINPLGTLEFNGFRAETTFFAGALEKYGVGVQVLKAGRYKSAVEPFVQTQSSPENREQIQALLADLWNEFLTATGTSRDIKPQELQAIADNNGLLRAKQAEELELVDEITYFDQVLDDLKDLTESDEEEPSFQQATLPQYAAMVASDRAVEQTEQTVAVVYAEGEIVPGRGEFDQVGGDKFAKILRELRLDDTVKAVVLRVNSPGGSATASEVIMREVLLTRKQKPVVVSMGTAAASGGYLISMQADQIFASPSTITGSIGVFGLLLNVQEIANQNGITWDIVKTGRYADITTLTRPSTQQELALQQQVVDEIYDRFVKTVAESRDLPQQRVAQIAEGRVWSGLDAQQLGLVDNLGGLTAAIQAAADQADLEEEDWQVEEYPKPPSLEELILGGLFNSPLQTKSDHPLASDFQKLRSGLEILKSLNDPQGIYTRLPLSTWID